MATVLLPAEAPPTDRSTTPARPQELLDRICLILVIAAALASAAFLYSHFRAVHRSLWYNGVHDRNAHFLTSLQIGMGLRQGNPTGLLRELYHANVWGPGHGLLTGLTIALAGPDSRMAVLPNLLAWAGSVILAFLLARRLTPRGGNLAGLVAALFVMASPSHRAFATDFMIESLGAFLTLLVLYRYCVLMQTPHSPSAGRWLGIALTILFLTKYNYWLLLALTLLAVSLPTAWHHYGTALRDSLALLPWKRWLLHPLSCLLAALLLTTVGLAVAGRVGRPVSPNTLGTLVYVSYVVLIARLASGWWTTGRHWLARQPRPMRQIVAWHAYPVIVWFLIPRRLSSFLWFVSPANAEPWADGGLAHSVRAYARWLAEEYHVLPWFAVAAVGLFLVALLMRRHLRPGALAVLVFVLLAAFLTAKHPNCKSRYMHSWVAVVWVGAGAGLACLLAGRWSVRRPALRATLAGIALVGLTAAHGPALGRPGHALEGGPKVDLPSDLDLVDLLLPEVDRPAGTLLLCDVPLRNVVLWNVVARHGSLDRLDQRWWGFAEAGLSNDAGFERWLATSAADTIVVFDCGERAAFWRKHDGMCRAHAEAIALLPAQSRFRLVASHALTDRDATVQVWRRAE